MSAQHKPEKTKVAIACQGGGSQTAFTAGALCAILNHPGFDEEFEIVGLSGTSGGAVCCMLTWYGLLAYPPGREDRGARVADLVNAFWKDNSAHQWWDRLFVNQYNVGVHRLQDMGWLGQFPPPGMTPPWVPDMVRAHLRRLLERYIPIGEVRELLEQQPRHATLLVGAVDILTGEFAVFEEACPDPGWRREHERHTPEAVSLDPVLASAAIPPLMRAMPVGSGHYWDGLYAHNPPIRDLVSCDKAMRPDEIWVIQIDPQSAEREPYTLSQIVDRRFELASNLSLSAEIHWIRQINQWVHEKILPQDKFKTIKVGRIHIETPLGSRLDLASKVDRDPRYLKNLMDSGRRQAAAFLDDRDDPNSAIWHPLYPRRYKPSSDYMTVTAE
jgi:NTE family protein